MNALGPSAFSAAPETVDVAILGGGCAGLSLAYRLAGASLSVRILEPRPRYTGDRVWSFWRTRPNPFEDCVVGRWARWSVTSGTRHIVRSSKALRYETVSADLFYRKCLARIEAAPNLRLDLGTRVEGLYRTPDGFLVETDGDGLAARHVVDTRPLGRRPSYAQSFVGREVATDEAVFDPETVELMSFGAVVHDAIPFLYVLPFSPTRALVEATLLGPAGAAPIDLGQRLDAALAQRLGGRPHRVLRQEAGAIPMDPAHEVRGEPGYLPLGLRAGAARPSTGYAFSRIQQMADAASRALIAGRRTTMPPLDGPVTRHMDRLFLKVILRHPERAPDLFVDLFEHAPADRLERFLSGSTAVRDRFAAVAALPPGLFARTAVLA